MKWLSLIVLIFVISISFSVQVHIKVPAVITYRNNTSIGTLADLYVEMSSGEGRVFVDTMPLSEVDTQASARISKEVSCELLDLNCERYDFFFIIRSDHPIVGGPSAGAAMTVATLSSMLNKPLNPNYIITGTINPDGSIGPVTGIEAKATVAKGKFSTILVPEGLKTDVEGIKVQEVKTIEEAFKIFTNYDLQKDNISISEIQEFFDELMINVSRNLLQEAKTKISVANQTLQKTENRILEEDFQMQLKLYNTSEKLFEQKEYYSSSSYSVRTIVGSQTIINKIENKSEDKLNYLEDKLNYTKSEIYKTRVLDNVNDIEALAISIERFKESQELYDKAVESHSSGDLESTAHYAAYVEARLLSIEQWLTLLNEFKGDERIVFNEDSIRELAIVRIGSARNSITYAKTMFPSFFLESASEYLESSVTAYNNGEYIHSLFEALKARALANLLIELRDIPEESLPSRIQSKDELTTFFIKRSKEKGVIPILALSYLQYARSLYSENDTSSSLIYYAYSKEFAGVTIDMSKEMKKEIELPTELREVDKQTLNIVIFFIAGMIIGLLIALKLRK